LLFFLERQPMKQSIGQMTIVVREYDEAIILLAAQD